MDIVRLKQGKCCKTGIPHTEDKGSGTGLIDYLKADGVRSIGINPEADKVVRMSTCSAKIEDGGVLLPKDAPCSE